MIFLRSKIFIQNAADNFNFVAITPMWYFQRVNFIEMEGGSMAIHIDYKLRPTSTEQGATVGFFDFNGAKNGHNALQAL